ncbi:hypothetical protein JQ554_19455 [Bradyrhizobium diazoefficiens]|nr:hypothetical protein [Bradyrhizobium diazoefficiens]UCF54566.1 MAG: hypothetical protein JSV48_10140 [Bradyrhizobium sp.]MBR0966387.1 hypothetical protein [Bradyrhizobium diazoefficiens]MBR0979857.1 hypothetical protein [Bradyrhizobium diazoefficiens]MBR1009205.1 hypothetical protein [Bradyrhizobium diazoefficiens]MBR1012414.1 hypothetical protein [Bradyrhizobium diazoefficiens]
MKIFARTALAIVGGYLGTSAIIAALSMIAVAMVGMERSEAATLGSMLGFVIYLGVMIWSFAEPALIRITLWLGAVTALSLTLVLLLGRFTS